MQIYQQVQLGKEDCPRFTNYPPVPSPSMGEGEGGVKKLESGLSPKFNASSKTTEIYTQVSTKNIGKIKSPFDNLNLNRGGDV
jgi:hypothetical protein